jgi:hypothetical protein
MSDEFDAEKSTFTKYSRIDEDEMDKKFTKKDWLLVEQRVSEFTKNVIDVLMHLANGNNQIATINDNFLSIGEDAYVALRPSLNKENMKLILDTKIYDEKSFCEVQQKDKKKTKSIKKSMTADEIRMKATREKIAQTMDTLLKSFNTSEMNFVYGIKICPYLEMRGITLMYCAWFFAKNKPDKYKKEKYREEVYELIVAIQKFINIKDKLNNVIKKDLENWLEELYKISQFDGLQLCEFAPRLLIFTKYDNAIPYISIRPRKNQIDLVNMINKYKSTGFLISLRAMLSSGKTISAATCIGTLLSNMNISTKASGLNQKTELIFCCNINAVRNDVARIAYNGGIKFGVANAHKNNVKIVNHNNTSDENRVLIVASPEAAFILLKEEDEKSRLYGMTFGKYWLFLDEPTIGADQIGSESLYENASLLTCMPRHTILSSATMCKFEKISDIVDFHKKKHPSIHVDTIISCEIQIGCDVKTFNNILVIPHLGCKTSCDLNHVLKTIDENPFIGRLYTSNVAKHLWTLMTQKSITVPNIKEIFSNSVNLSFDKIKGTCVEMLKILSEQTDSIIREICDNKIVSVSENTRKNVDSVFQDDIDDSNDSINFELLSTIHAHKYMKMNLIVDANPEKFAEKNFNNILLFLKKRNITSASELFNSYKLEMVKYNEKLERLDKRVKNEDKKIKQIQEFNENIQPKILFPACCQINTKSHVNEFSSVDANNLTNVRPELQLELFPVDEMCVPEWMLLLLYCGVGIISSKNNDHVYTKIVLNYASNGQLAYIVSDGSISYGTNYPIVRVFVTEDFSKTCSINTIFQLLGRAGRVGQSWKAEAFISDNLATELLEYVKDSDNHHSALIEPNNMNAVFSQIIERSNSENEKKREEFLEKNKQNGAVKLDELRQRFQKK